MSSNQEIEVEIRFKKNYNSKAIDTPFEYEIKKWKLQKNRNLKDNLLYFYLNNKIIRSGSMFFYIIKNGEPIKEINISHPIKTIEKELKDNIIYISPKKINVINNTKITESSDKEKEIKINGNFSKISNANNYEIIDEISNENNDKMSKEINSDKLNKLNDENNDKKFDEIINEKMAEISNKKNDKKTDEINKENNDIISNEMNDEKIDEIRNEKNDSNSNENNDKMSNEINIEKMDEISYKNNDKKTDGINNEDNDIISNKINNGKIKAKFTINNDEKYHEESEENNDDKFSDKNTENYDDIIYVNTDKNLFKKKSNKRNRHVMKNMTDDDNISSGNSSKRSGRKMTQNEKIYNKGNLTKPISEKIVQSIIKNKICFVAKLIVILISFGIGLYFLLNFLLKKDNIEEIIIIKEESLMTNINYKKGVGYLYKSEEKSDVISIKENEVNTTNFIEYKNYLLLILEENNEQLNDLKKI